MASCSVAAVTTLSCLLLLLLISPVRSLTCTSQTLKNNKKFDRCLDLPTLDAYLHYTYNATNSSLSIAFMAPPAKPEGWVAWAINPKGQGMIGSQALLAFKSNNKVVVKTFDVSSYSSITESDLAFETWDLSAEESSKNLVIYGSMKVEEKAKKLNQVWQVGGEVVDGRPKMHDFQPDNVNSKETLVLDKSHATPGPSSSPPQAADATSPSSSSSSSSSSPSQEPAKGGQSLIKSNPMSLFFGLLLFISGVFVY